MGTEDKELDFVNKDNFSQSWIVELNQKLTFCVHKITNRTDITDEDYELLRVLYKTYYNGEYMIYGQKGISADETAVQGGLFSDNNGKVNPDDDLGILVDHNGE